MKIRRKIRHKNPGALKIIMLTLATFVAIMAIFVTFNVISTVNKINSAIPDITNAKLFNMASKSKILAADGQTVLAELQLENRQPVSSLNEISNYTIKGTISTEDARFYEHKGVDPISIIRAIIATITGHQTQGGSTITMQLMRNTILTKDAQTISIERKIAEIVLSSRMEEIYSKDEILLMYLNTINYGDGCYGIKAAAEHYFSKTPDNLTLSEAASLVGIPQSPTYLAPTKNLAACQARRNDVLGRMLDDHVITNAEANAAMSQPIELNLTYADLNSQVKYPYFTDYVRQQLFNKYSAAEIFEGGWQVYTTLDVHTQEATEAGCNRANQSLEKDAESVAVSVSPENGYILSMVGGKDYSQNQFNIAADKGRPTGSSFKAFTLVASIEDGYDPKKTTVNCSSPMYIGNTRIENFDNQSMGTRTIQSATAASSNTGFVRIQQAVGTDKVITTAKKMGIKNANLPEVSTLTLGVADVTPLEMASAYATLANGGTYHEPIAIEHIETYDGDIIYQHDPVKDKGERVLSPEVAGATTKVLETVFTSGTGTGAAPSNGQPVAGKTGTSEDFRDHTLIGYTPKISLATWIGKRNYQPTSSYVSCNQLFRCIMDGILQNKQIIEFPETNEPKYTKTKNIEGDKRTDRDNQQDNYYYGDGQSRNSSTQRRQ
ncbi:MAG: transglycosylase domain-containing protein [Coriobacteriia bacterium]|nr:transglycosylase domain-containing protein [Coriobacteriia bacterium]